MTYCLLGKVNWNNEFGSNLLCGCPKRLGVIDNDNHECVLMTDKVQKQKYLSAKAYFNALIAKGEDELLAKENMNKWAAVSNDGINGKPFCCFSFTIIITQLNLHCFKILYL